MKTSEEIAAYIAQLVPQGISAYKAAPPFYRFVWRLGFNVTPPFNQTFLKNFIYMWVFMFAFVSIVLPVALFVLWGFWWSNPWSYVITTVTKPTFFPGIFVGGFLFGLLNASFIQYRRRSLNIPKW